MLHRTILLAGLALATFAASPPAAPVPPATMGATTIHTGDQLSVQVYGDATLSQNVMVLPDGTVDYPLIGRVQVAGKTPTAAASALASRLLRYVRHPVVTISISTLAQPTVLVLGDVKTPGKYQLRSDGRISDAIAAAGGLGAINGAYPDARVSDSAGNVSSVSLEKLLRKGDVALDRPLGEGSVVYVPGPEQFTVEVAGAVDHPGDVTVNEGDHLSVAIAKAGNSANAQSDLNRIRVIRVVDGKQTVTQVNLYQAINDGDSSVDLTLHKGDVVYVPQAAKKGEWAGSGFLYLLSRLIP